MKVVEVVVPDCYGTFNINDNHCTECSSEYYCMDETENIRLKKEVDNKRKPK